MLSKNNRSYIQKLNAFQVKHDVKARLTLSSSGASGGEGARTHVQVLANSGVASALILLHLFVTPSENLDCWKYGTDLLVVGIVRYLLDYSMSFLAITYKHLEATMPPWQQTPSPLS